MTQKKKIYPTRDNKLKASKALEYEWRMLNECAARIPLYENKDKVTYNALIEAFCVHLRNFIEFFYRQQKGKRPFWADFLPEGKIIQLKHKLDKYNEQVNDLLSHLTYKRLKYSELDKEWHIHTIANKINENMFDFIESADKNLLCDEITIYKKQLESCNAIKYNRFTCTSSDAVGQSQLD